MKARKKKSRGGERVFRSSRKIISMVNLTVIPEIQSSYQPMDREEKREDDRAKRKGRSGLFDAVPDHIFESVRVVFSPSLFHFFFFFGVF